MKKLKHLFVTLLALVLPLTVWADDTELKVFKSTFIGNTYGIAGETYATGTLNSQEGNDWVWNAPGESQAPAITMTEYSHMSCLSAKVKTDVFDLTSDFSVPGTIRKVFMLIAGNIGKIELDFGTERFSYDINITGNGFSGYSFTYDSPYLQSSLPNQCVGIAIHKKDAASDDPMYIQEISVETEVASVGENSIVSEFIAFDDYNSRLVDQSEEKCWKLELPTDGTTLEGYPATWNGEKCAYLRLTGGSSSYPRLTLSPNFPLWGKVKKIVVSAGGDVRFASYTKSDGEVVNSHEAGTTVPYYDDFILDFGDGIQVNDDLSFYLYAGRNTYLKSITVVMEGGAAEIVGITSTFSGWEEWDVTDSYKVGSMKTKEDTPWISFITDPTTSVYMTSIRFGEDTEPEECLVIGGNDGKQFELGLQNQFTVTGPVKKIIVRYTGHIEEIGSVISERNTSGENEQFVRVTPRVEAGFTDAELVFNENIEYTDADIHLFMVVHEPVFLKSITIVQEERSNSELPSGKCGDNLEFALTPLSYTVWVWDNELYRSVEVPAYKLTITGNGDMYDYSYDYYNYVSTAPWMKDYCDAIAEIDLPEGLTRVGDEAFDGCGNARVLNLPSTLKSVGTYAFSGIYNWPSANLRLPDGLVSISSRAFAYCGGIQNFYIPASLTSIGVAAIVGINSLENFYVDEGNPAYKATGNAVIEKATNTLIAGNKNTVIPDDVEIIGNYAFYNVSAESIPIPGSVKSIGDDAFGYSKITSLDIPSSVTTISNYAFYGCSKLLTVNIGSGVTSIGYNVFSYSNNILDVNCYADPDALTWTSSSDESKLFKSDKMTQMHVRATDLEKWQEKFGFLNVTFVGDLGATITPITEDTHVMASALQGQNLSDNIIGNIYYNFDASTGNGYMDGYLYITQTTDMSQISDGTPGSPDVRDNFTGIILEVGPGKGVISLDVAAKGRVQLAVQIGNGTPTYAASDKRREVYVSYNVTEPTFVYIYAVGSDAALVRAYGNGEDDIYNNVLLIYGFTVYPGADEDGIRTIDNGELTIDNEIYDLSGHKIGKPQKGINIIRYSDGTSKKLLVK